VCPRSREAVCTATRRKVMIMMIFMVMKELIDANVAMRRLEKL
jgi:hypothetical protein